ncbi:hypothetical protein A176_007273 [Myxococcus hansupus]|uniref:Uncharacterized protein n=1 Tax=Pseudomyxococcus hansupus TaxID=1297742 RepID=A0A0H4X3V6_9BACT|nr:hypothetical protein A176_007273 [Myxococcus hansupus]
MRQQRHIQTGNARQDLFDTFLTRPEKHPDIAARGKLVEGVAGQCLTCACQGDITSHTHRLCMAEYANLQQLDIGPLHPGIMQLALPLR